MRDLAVMESQNTSGTESVALTSYFLLVAVLCVAIYASLNRVIPETYSVVSAVVLIVREQTPLFATDISAFLSCAGSVRCPTLITALAVPQVGRDYSVPTCLP